MFLILGYFYTEQILTNKLGPYVYTTFKLSCCLSLLLLFLYKMVTSIRKKKEIINLVLKAVIDQNM